MGLPLEAVVKEFRNTAMRSHYDRVGDCMDDFIAYLRSGVHSEQDDEETLVLAILYRFYDRISKGPVEQALKRWVEDLLSRKESGNAISAEEAVAEKLSAVLRLFRAGKESPCFDGVDAAELRGRFATQAAQAIEFGYSGPRDKKIDELLVDVGAEVLYREKLSPQRSGVVIAGFGSLDRCPSLRYIEADGVIAGCLKWTEPEQSPIDIGRRTTGAEILAFAQRDVAEMFLTGILPDEEAYILRYIERQFKNIAALVSEEEGDESQESPKLSRGVAKLVSDLRENIEARKKRQKALVQIWSGLCPFKS